MNNRAYAECGASFELNKQVHRFKMLGRQMVKGKQRLFIMA